MKYNEAAAMVLAIVFVVVVLLGAFALRYWQCDEMFPNASKLACILWK